MKRASFWVVVAAAVVASALAHAQPRGMVKAAVHPANPGMFAAAAAVNTRPMSPQQREEWRFLKDTAATSRFESEAARLALAKSSDPGIRAFAATLINHHTSAGNELVQMLQVRGMAPPMLANEQRKTLNRLAKLQGAKFDREFIGEVALKVQQDDVLSFEKASMAMRDPRLKAWVDRTLPTLRYHLATAERLAPADQALAANPFVSRASLATRAMGAGGATPVGLTRPLAAKKASGSSSR